MDYYKSASHWYESAKFSITGGFYQQSVSQSCLSAELFLKSQLSITEPNSELDKSHDTLNIFKTLSKRFPAKRDMLQGIRYCRKYFNESRYPFGNDDIYTKEFAEEFLGYVKEIKRYIDEDCQSTIDDLQHKYTNNQGQE